MRAVLNKGTIEEIKLYLQSLGWSCEERLTGQGWTDFGYSIWFNRYDWHGVQLGNRVSINCHVSRPDAADIRRAVVKAARLALEAWETYVEAVPRMDIAESLSTDTLATEHFLRMKSRTKSRSS